MAGNQYVSSVKYAAIPVWTASTTLAVGALRRQTVAAEANARVFRVSVITTGTTGATEPAWQLGAGATTTDGGVTWVETTGSSWSAPHKRIQNSLQTGWGSTNNVFIYVDSTHNYSVAAVIDWSGSTSLGLGASRKIISVNAAGSVPPVAADYLPGARESTTGANNFICQPSSGCGTYIAGVSVFAGVGASTVATIALNTVPFLRWRDATISVNSTQSSTITFGQTATDSDETEFTNVIFKFGSVSSSIRPQGGRWWWTGGSVDPAVIPSLLFSMTGPQGYGIIEGVDLSSITGLVLAQQLASHYVQFVDCKTTSSNPVTFSSNAYPTQTWVDFINCDSGAATYTRSRYMIQGTMTTDINNVRTGGASDGTTPYSWKIVTNNTPQNYDGYVNPFTVPQIDIYSDTSRSVVITLNILSSLVLKDNDIGFDVYYLGNAGTTRASIASTIPNILSTGNNLPSGAYGWNTLGVPTPSQQQISVTIVPVMVGMFRLQPKVLRAGLTVWLDPVPVGMTVGARITMDSNIRTVLV